LLDIRATILIGAATCLVTALVAFLMWEPQHEATTSAPRARYWATIGSAFREVWHNRAVRAVVLLTGTVFASLEAVMYLIQPYLLDRGIEIGVVFSMLQVPTLIAGAAGALLASRVHGHARLLMLALPACGVAAYIALALGPGLSAYAAFPLMYLFASCLMPLATGQINRNIGSAQRATILSIHGMVASLLLAALAPGVGFTTDNQGLPQAFALGAGVTLLSLVLFGSMLVGTRRASAESAPMPAPADV
ncbi:MAG TPA: MFS transporter, partial [Gemmatimonadaceae bacterium]|nr:MFS transporter [Gemmatimonadaceae bacterium]